MKINFYVSASLISITLMIFSSGCNKLFQTMDGGGDTVITIKAKQGDALAEVGKVTLTVEEMQQDFLERQGHFRGAPNLNTEKARNDYIENQVIQEAMFQEAVKLGYFDKSDVKRNIKKIVVQSLMRDKLEEAQKQFVPTEEQMQEHYNKHINLYKRDEAVKVAFISIPFGKDITATKKAASAIQADALVSVKNANSRQFGRLAMKHTDKLSGLGNMGIETNETGYLEQSDFDKKFGKGSFDSIKSMENIGQISSLMTTDKAFVIMMKTGYRKQLNETVADAKEKIAKRLSYENRSEIYNQYVEGLRQKYNIKVYRDKIAELSKDASDKNLAQATEAEDHQR